MTQRVVNYTYGTGNPVLPDGSIDVRDGIDNLQSMDVFMNAPEDTYNQRDGNVVRTVAGMNSKFDAQILNMGFTRVGTFAAGATITNPRQTLLWDSADGGDGQEYGWSGEFPKTVPPGSTPASTGGIEVGAWISRVDPTTRQQTRETIRRSYAEAGLTLVAGSFEVGGVLTSANDVLLHESSGKAYSGAGPFPQTVAAGTSISGFTARDSSALRADLISSQPGNGIDLVFDGARHSRVADGVVFLADYAAMVTGGDDWTVAINTALETGKDVRGEDNRTYKVSGILKSRGQRLLGDWAINPTHVTHATIVKANVGFDTTDRIRMIYMEVHYDLCEMLVIKSLGFNMVAHYTNFTHPEGAGGSVQQMLDNAATAGLRVQIDVQQGMDHNALTLSQLVTLCDQYPATWGYSVYDEPATRNISVVDQDSRITAMRTLTGKVLTTVDLVVTSNPPFYQKLSFNYDYVFVNSYAQRYTTGTDQDKRDWDMEKSRLDVGGMMALSRNTNILFVGGLFIDHSPSGQYTQNKQQGIDHVLNYLKHSGGEYGVFIWDMPFNSVSDDTVSNSLDYQRACLKLSQQMYGEKSYTMPYIFGSAPGYADFGLGDLMRHLPVKDPNNVQVIPWGDSYPANTFLNATDKLSGIGFKLATSNFATTIPCHKFVSVYLDTLSAVGGSIPGAATLQLFGWNGELTRPITPTFPIGVNRTFYGSSKWDGLSRNEQLLFSVVNGITDTKYSLLLRGLVVCTDW